METLSQGRSIFHDVRYFHTDIEDEDHHYCLTQIDTGPISLSVDPITPGAWQSNH